MLIRTPIVYLIKEHIKNVHIPKQEKKINLSFVKLAPFIFIAIFIGGINDSSFGALFPAYMINEFFTDRQIGLYFFIGLFMGVISQPFIGALTDKINKRKFIFSLLVLHLIWPLLLLNFISSISIIILSVLIWGIASVSIYTVTLAYLGERVTIKELSIATSVFIIVYEFGEFIGPIIVGYFMDLVGNVGFIYTSICITFFSLLLGLLRSYIKNK
jgi:YNFM family putative membrane transporter